MDTLCIHRSSHSPNEKNRIRRSSSYIDGDYVIHFDVRQPLLKIFEEQTDQSVEKQLILALLIVLTRFETRQYV